MVDVRQAIVAEGYAPRLESVDLTANLFSRFTGELLHIHLEIVPILGRPDGYDQHHNDSNQL